MTRASTQIGARVRVLSGALAGRIGVIAGTDDHNNIRVRFEPPTYVAAVGRVASVWRSAVDIEFLKVEVNA